jgi:hypothetical protein
MQTDVSRHTIGYDQIVLTNFSQRLKQGLDFNVLKIPLHFGVGCCKRLPCASTHPTQEQDAFEETIENDCKKFIG